MMQFPRIQNVVLTISRHNDLILAVLLVAIISLIILPLPTPLIDTLITTNLGIAITLLMLSLYIPNSVSLSTFPTLLLMTTLFRLALNIATTRLILINADAGMIIHTFGNFVVAGNFVVGAVVFLIITIVQFLVIAKGSERVAEVAARFTLDALPGKQMSIDADLRAGSIDMAEAKKRRKTIQLESSLYGAMDGAMKFVKGDAIAGLIITVINIIGGISIGVLQKGLTTVTALKTYSLLTIGDGLVSQIPALFISITAGIIVTRTTDEEMSHLGGEIGYQMLSQPKGLLIGGLILCIFSLIPGFPKIQFIVLGAGISLVGFVFMQRTSKPADSDMESMIDSISDERGQTTAIYKKVNPQNGDFPLTVPLQLNLHPSLKDQINPISLNKELIRIRRALYMDIGVPFPGIHLKLDSSISTGEYKILIHEIPVAMGKLHPNRLFVPETGENLKTLGIDSDTDRPFLPGHPATWVTYHYKGALETAGITHMETSGLLAYHLSIVLKENAAEFLGLQEIKHLIEKMAEYYPDLVQELQKILSIPQITDVLQRLVEEEISIRNLKTIFHCLIEWGQKEKDIVLLTEYVRTGLKRYISYRYSAGRNMLAVYMLDRELEEMIRNAIRKTSGGTFLVLAPEMGKQIIDAIKDAIGEIKVDAGSPVLLTSMDIRRYVKKLIGAELKALPVLSYQELTPEISIQPLGRIQVSKEA